MTPSHPHTIAEKLQAVREAFRNRRLARGQRHLYSFYVEHNLLVQAVQSRTVMLDHLRHACRQWRTALDLAL